jgi:hypothetical protein
VRQRRQEAQTLWRSPDGFTTKTSKVRHLRRHHRFRCDRRRSGRRTALETLLDISRDIQPRAAIGDKGYNSKANRSAASTRYRPGCSAQDNENNKPKFVAGAKRSARLH